MAGHGRNAAENWRRVRAWLEGEQIRDLFVSRAYLATIGQLRYLLALPEQVNCNLWLIIQRQRLRGAVRHALDLHQTDDLTFGQFEKQWTKTTKPQRRPTRAADPIGRSHIGVGLASLRVPLVEPLVFRDACRRLLTPARFKKLDAIYVAAGTTTQDWVQSQRKLNEQNTTAFLSGLIEDAPTLDEALVRVRAAQVVCFLNGWWLKTELETLAGARDEDAISRLTPEAARLLRYYASPHYPALALVRMVTRASLADLAALTIADAADGGSIRVGKTTTPIPAYAQGILRTQLAHRRLETAEDHDPLFASRPRNAARADMTSLKPNTVRLHLNKVAHNTGLALTVRGSSWAGPDEREWRTRYGVSVKPLAEPAKR